MMLSIVIPVYQVESTLDRCVQSIVSQTFQDWEAILVDDGSPDRCPSMCDEWSQRDPRIRVVHQPNGGLSAARNAGIKEARGAYITFVDSDDYLSRDVLLQLMHLIEEHPDYDILEYSMKQFSDETAGDYLQLKNRVLHDQQAYWLEEQAYLHTYACNKIFRKRLFDSIRFPVGRVFEDAFTLPLLLRQASTIATTSIGYYHYYKNEKGITAKADGEAWQSLLEAHLNVLKKMLPLQTPSAQRYYMHVLNIQLYTHALNGKEPCLPTYTIRQPWKMQTIQEKMKALALNFIGVKGLCRLYRTFKRI